MNALTVDVEDYFHVAAFADCIDRSSWAAMPARVEANTARLLDLFDETSVRATFFTLGWVAERFPRIVRDIHERGHEVACHGMSHRLIYEQTPEEFRAETVRSKKLLEDIIGAPIWGYRAASYSITAKSLWAVDIIADAGFRYDSSIAPVRHDLYGIPNAERAPHKLQARSGAELAEFPPTSYSLFGVNLPVGGGGYFRLYPYRLTAHLLRRINEAQGQPFIFYLHPWEVDPQQPRVAAGVRSRFRHYLNLDKTEPRLRRLLGEFRFGTARSVLRGIGLLPD